MREPTVESFISMGLKQQLHWVALLYTLRCTEEDVFMGGRKLCPTYHITKNFLFKHNMPLPIMYRYLYDLPCKQILNVMELLRESEQYQKNIEIWMNKNTKNVNNNAQGNFTDFSLDMLGIGV